MTALDRLMFLLVRVSLYGLVFAISVLIVVRYRAGAIPLETCVGGLIVAFLAAYFSIKRDRGKGK